MTDELKQTVRLQRPSQVTVDEDGRTVWGGPVEELELELLSTRKLKQMLSEDDKRRRQLEALADGRDGVLARHVDKDAFAIIDDAELEAALASANDDAPVATTTAPDTLADRMDTADEALSLVSTMALRRILGNDGEPELAPDDDDLQRDSGFDPYNSV